jgi:hypothetical protein
MGKNWAIVIGINNYDNLQPLKYAKRDAEVMAAWLSEEAQFEQVFLFTEDSPPIPTNPPIPTQPTFGRLRRFLQTQFENTQQTLLKSGDNLWFFFAGHGKRFADQDYLMLPDSDLGDLGHTAISVDYVTQRLRRSGADNVVLFLDACRDQGDRMGLGIGEQRHQGVITFYSCTANQQSWEIDELQHGSLCTAIFRSGVLIACMTAIKEHLLMVVHGLIMIIYTECCAVVLGTTVLSTAVRRLATTSLRAAGTTTSVFVLCVLLGDFLALDTFALFPFSLLSFTLSKRSGAERFKFIFLQI